MNEPLFSYIEDHRGHKVGCLAYENGIFGFSICHKNDQFSKKRARAIALGRAKANRGETEDFNIVVRDPLYNLNYDVAGEWKKEALVMKARAVLEWINAREPLVPK